VQRLELGLWYNTQLTLEAPFIFGEGKSDGYGPTAVELLYNLNQETVALPAVTVGGTLITPTGEYSEGLDSRVELLLTKTIPGTAQLHRVHLNAAYLFNDDEEEDERSGAYEVVLGYEARVSNPVVLVADVFRKQEVEAGSTTNLGEVGARYRLNPYTVLTAGVGVGFGEDAAEFRGTTGVQMEFFGW
jgi:hypothetical protein